MPSISTASYNPYQAKVIEAPVMGSFADMWGTRQESDIILEDGLKKSASALALGGVCADAPYEESSHTIRVIKHNPYSLTQPLTQVYTCHCSQCQCNEGQQDVVGVVNADAADVDAHYVLEDITEAASKFMPPPPPRMDTYDVISACGAVDPDSIVYHMMMRWFSKVSRIQSSFEPTTECPPPSPTEYSFVEWCGMVNEWWYANFEHRQKKQTRHNGHW